MANSIEQEKKSERNQQMKTQKHMYYSMTKSSQKQD